MPGALKAALGPSAPCANCPFRSDGAAIGLAAGRLASIIAGMVADDRKPFVCHKTLGHTRGLCRGALIYLHKIGQPNVSLRLAFAWGLIQPEALEAQHTQVIAPLEPTPHVEGEQWSKTGK